MANVPDRIRNQSTDLHGKSIDWFLYDGNHLSLMGCNTYKVDKKQGIFRTSSNIYDGAILRKYLTGFNR